MFDWIWQHITGVILNWFFTSEWGIVIGVMAGGALIGVAFKFLGWRGVVGALAGLAGLFAYRSGWKARDSLDTGGTVPPPGPRTILPPLAPAPPRNAPARPAKPSPSGIDPSTGTWPGNNDHKHH